MSYNRVSLVHIDACELTYYPEETVGQLALSIMGMLDLYYRSPDRAVSQEELAVYFWRQATLSIGS